MTSSAKARRVVVVVLLLALVGAVGGTGWLIGSRLPTLPEGEYATLHLADPIELTDGDTTHRISRIVVNFDKRMLTLERDELAFDDYGDATRTGGANPLTMRARFNRELLTGYFEIVPATRFDQRLRLVVGSEMPNTCRLIVLGKHKDGSDSFDRILELRRPDVVPDELGNDPQPDRFTFETLGHGSGLRGLKLYGIGLSGALARDGRLSIDPNHYQFNPDGSTGASTLLASSPVEVTFKELGADPAKRGRRVFELVPKKADAPDVPKETYVLVLGPTEPSEHRLVIKSGGKAQQVLSLRNTDRDNHLHMTQRFKTLPAEEREAYRELGKLTGFRGGAVSDNKHIYAVHALDGDASRYDQVLRRFPHLRELNFTDATLPASGLPCLADSKELNTLTFTQCELSDDGLASVGKAIGLRRFSIYSSKGPTAVGLAHLAPLTNLESLEIRRDENPPDVPRLDDGLKHLAEMKQLRNLNLQGQNVSDAGLVHVGRLTALRGLRVSGPGITDDGLKHLDGLTNLVEFSVVPSQVTPAGLAAFRAKMPAIKK